MFKIYKTYYRFFWRYKLRALIFGVFLVLLGIVESIQPYFYKLFVDYLQSNQIDLVWKVLIGLILVRFAQTLLDIITFIFGDWLHFSAGRDARLEVFSKIQDLDFAYHLKKSTGSLISAMKRGDGSFFALHHILNIRFVLMAISFAVMLFFFNSVHPLAVVLLFLQLTLNVIAALFLVRINMKRRLEFVEEEDTISAIIVDNMINFETVKLFAQEQQERNRLQKQFVKWMDSLWGYANTFRLIDIVIGTLANTGLAALLYLGLYQVVHEQLSLGQYVMMLGFVQAFYPKFFQFVYELRNVAKHQADIEKYFAVLEEETEVKDPTEPVQKDTIEGHIDFDQVSFSYPEGKQDAVVGFDLQVKAGESIAFVGHSGSGKTTLIKLLMRFYDPDEGAIKLDGTDIRDFTKDHLRSFMGVVPQDPILFNDTVRFNLSYGSSGVTEEELWQAIAMANLEEVMETLPQGLNTMVGERGIKLSGGQKQRLAIARMMLSNPEIVIFDEATSQLDSESEKKIQDAFWRASADKTTFIIAHRLSTVVKADRIIVMDDGQIVEMGTHKQLLKKDGTYAHLWNLQVQAE